MDNHNPPSSYPYNNPYPYPYYQHPPPAQNHGYPPPNSGSYYPYFYPQNYPYPYNPYTYPQPGYTAVPPSASSGTSHSGPLDCPSPPHSTTHSGPLGYSHNHSYSNVYSPSSSPQALPPPTHQRHGSFQYGSSQYPYQHQSGEYPSHDSSGQVPSRSNSFGNHHRQDSLDTKPNSPASLYPPLDDLLSKVKLDDGQKPSALASPPAPSVPPLPDSPVSYQSESPVFYGYPNNSFSSNWEGAYLGRIDSSGQYASSVHTHSASFDGSQYNHNMQIVPVKSSKVSLKVLLLHGNLDIWVYDAKNLPNMDMFHKTLGEMFNKLPGNIGSKIEGQMNRKITSDPYVTISLTGSVICRTYVISNSEDPVWMQHFNVPVAHHAAELQFVVKDSDVVGSQLIGVVAIPVEQIYSGAKVEGVYPILNSSGKPCKPGAVLRISIQYIPMEKLSNFHPGVGAGPDYHGVLNTYFPLRKGGKVTLYQDAHVPDGCLPSLKLGNGMSYVHGKCWYDIFDAIRQARRLIYITGWSVWHQVRLVRDAGHPSDATLGEILRSKSQEGVRVLLLVWDDPTSRSILGYKTDGIMATHDEETRRFFKSSSVQVLLCPRIAGKRHSWVKQTEVGTIYTHHQKTVIVDADAGNNRRKIIAFVGGLDLCDGRYDTPQHPIFRTLQTVHKDDYHNPNYNGNTAGCPREPWHDMHCKIDGPAAYDVLTNFEERWLKASKPHGIRKLKKSYDDSLLRLERVPDILGLLDVPALSEDDPEAWHVQIFRSIDSNSVKGFPKDPKKATAKHLVCGKNVLIDMSIHTAYVKAIRAAQHFIYIENQYFIGSSYNWGSHKDLGATNLIPMEIALKIADKIRAKERFAAYIVIPMWPEGAPTGAATQRILFWQHKTMQMMYQTIYRALVETGLEQAFSPQDFLNFFCLGNREAPDPYYTSNVSSPTAANTPQVLSQKNRRFMIYVHSKGMIVDDEYVILGSANINQRSMEGTRDTEIAMGAYQPHYTWARNQSKPRGQVYGYRMSLWAEHVGHLEECFEQPESLECVNKIRVMGEMNWKQFADDAITEMSGHLLKYPVEVDRKGKVRPLPGSVSFPDVGGNILGSFTAIQENLTI
ncbi:hypothetical protein K2173_013378 [Erythroxylum novogranatense]|uniref:Phospholipase D alpha 1 n=1 Tax=Erythroxylum novogranatense TaxID=1862640 RepID=A0AAV8S9P6_9ROSI|nr:hypothetical protein K2173_013378 [Erythroxylum novogranatense]